MTARLRIVPVHTPSDRMRFIKFPWKVYRGRERDPYWVPPLIFERKRFFDPLKNPFFEHAEVQLFLAERDGETVGTIAAIINHSHNEFHNEQAGFFGCFEVLDDPEAACALLDTAVSWVAARGMTIIRGPANFSTNDECGLLIDGFDSPPVVMMTYNPPRYVEYIERFGFRKAMDLYAYIVEQENANLRRSDGRPSKFVRVAEAARQQSGVTFRKVRMHEFDLEVDRAWQVYNRAWERNWGFVPMTKAEFYKLAHGLKSFLDPDLLFVAEDNGEPVGISVSLPDINIPLLHMNGRLLPFGWARFLWWRRKISTIRVMIMGVVPEYRGRGIDAVFYYDTFRIGTSKGYNRAEMSWILESNVQMNRILRSFGGRVYKTYRMYELPLDGHSGER
ncbi:MAG: hypothetical protein KatS3mg057_0890 [Herpetosiphonaceae bacterium]|nr:MAG: hypothetical protein KatS3mg057_0890 [Herpetosiphonaceae bacterium]